MDSYESLFSAGGVLNGQIARQIFDIIPDDTLIMVIMDKEGNSWPSDSERFCKLAINDEFLRDLCRKVDDGQEPVVSQSGETGLVAAQVSGEHAESGYVILALPDRTPEAVIQSMDLLEVILGQLDLIAKLIEKNDKLYESQMRNLAMYVQPAAPSN